jgi:sulfatase maturation enzyme AslB (radical SAM superfamily)
MNQIHLTNDGPPNIAVISFKPHNVCNFTCDYCHPNSNDGSERWNTNYMAVANFVNTIREKNKHVCLEILGGEPTMWPQLQNFVNAISHENLIIELNTNGSRTLRYWEDFKPGNNVIIFSWHSKEVNTSHMIKVIEIMKDKCHAVVTVLMTPVHWEKGIAAIKEFEKIENLSIEVKPTRISLVSHELYPFTDDQLEYISSYKHERINDAISNWIKLYPSKIKLNNTLKSWKDMTINKEHIFKDWKCNAGIDRFVIEPSGNILRCWPNVGGSIGNVYTDYQLPTEPIKCTFDKPCHCKLDAMIEKWSPDYV